MLSKIIKVSKKIIAKKCLKHVFELLWLFSWSFWTTLANTHAYLCMKIFLTDHWNDCTIFLIIIFALYHQQWSVCKIIFPFFLSFFIPNGVLFIKLLPLWMDRELVNPYCLLTNSLSFILMTINAACSLTLKNTNTPKHI